jgi:hypothetical protein
MPRPYPLERYFKAWRDSLRMTQDDAAFQVEHIATEWGLDTKSRKIPTSRASISRIESGDVDCSPIALELLGATYKCHPLALISRAPDAQPGLWEIYDQLDARGRERLQSYAEGLLEKESAA